MSLGNFPNIAHRVFNRPHLVDPSYARTFIGALSDRLDVGSLVLPDGARLDGNELQAAAGQFEPGAGSIVDSVAGVAVIPVVGTLVHRFGYVKPYSGMTGYDGIQVQLEEALDDPSIRGILLDINSPGGELAGCFDLADFVRESRSIKPIWAVVDEWAASAAYALAAGAERIVAPRTAQAGSIGVLMAHVDHSKRLDQAGLAVTLIFSGNHKVDGNPFEALPDSVRKDLQADLDADYGEFITLVARGRGMKESAIRGTQARVFTGQRAVAAGLVDDIMPAHEVLDAFLERLDTGSAERGRETRTAAGPARPPARTMETISANYWSEREPGEA